MVLNLGDTMNRRRFLVFISALFLSGCGAGHTVYVVGRTNGLTAQNKFRLANQDAPVSFALGNETYTGRWVFVEGGGSVGIGTATAFSGSHSATASGMAIGIPTSATGTYLGSSPDGTTLRCSYTFSEMNLKGLGVCEDSKGETYDLQIFWYEIQVVSQFGIWFRRNPVSTHRAAKMATPAKAGIPIILAASDP
jgi:hypothetical protein